MQRLITIAFILLASSGIAFAEIITVLRAPGDTGHLDYPFRDSLRPEWELLKTEYHDLIRSRIYPLKYADITIAFGSQLEKLPDDCALPSFVPMTVIVSGSRPNNSNNQRHAEFYAIGDLGCLEVIYGWDSQTPEYSAIYFRADAKFVPLSTTNYLPERLEWEKAKFDLVKKWFDNPLPKTADLGTVEVSGAASLELLKRLTSRGQDYRGRQNAFKELQRQRGEPATWLSTNLGTWLSTNLGTLLAQPSDHRYSGPAHMAMMTAAEYRIDLAVPVLVSNINYRLDRDSFPAGSRLAPVAVYPAASALAKIGGSKLPDLLIEQIRLNENEEVGNACAWVLREDLGKELASYILQQASERERDSKVSNRLNTLLKAVKADDELLSLPVADLIKSK